MPTEKQYAEFGRKIVEEFGFENHIDGGSLQEWGVQAGVYRIEKYVRAKHGRQYADFEEGDDFYVLNEEPQDA